MDKSFCPNKYIDELLEIIKHKKGICVDFIKLFDINDDNLCNIIIPRAVREIFAKADSINLVLLHNFQYIECKYRSDLIREIYLEFCNFTEELFHNSRDKKSHNRRKLYFGDNSVDIVAINICSGIAEFASKYPRNLYYPNIETICCIYALICYENTIGEDELSLNFDEVYLGVKYYQKDEELAKLIEVVFKDKLSITS